MDSVHFIIAMVNVIIVVDTVMNIKKGSISGNTSVFTNKNTPYKIVNDTEYDAHPTASMKEMNFMALIISDLIRSYTFIKILY